MHPTVRHLSSTSGGWCVVPENPNRLKDLEAVIFGHGHVSACLGKPGKKDVVQAGVRLKNVGHKYGGRADVIVDNVELVKLRNNLQKASKKPAS